MKCPYCYRLGMPYKQGQLYQSDKNIPLMNGTVVDVYECHWHNARFVVLSGTSLCSDEDGNTFDLTTGVQITETRG
jgi:nitrite reductase/ring-hydroxylating ferredoxin subunit